MSQKTPDSDVGSKVWATPGPVARNRLHCTLTVHPETLPRLDAMVRLFESSRGRIFDKLVLTLYKAYTTKKVHCIHGEMCKIGREDLPEIL